MASDASRGVVATRMEAAKNRPDPPSQRGAVSQWITAFRRGGKSALRSRPIRGSPPKLTPEQKNLIPDFLDHGAEAYDFRGEVWTCARVAQVIREEWQVDYSLSQVAHLLKALHWSPQIPVTQAQQRNEEAIQRWREERWPELWNQARRERKTLVFIDESGFYLLPGVVKTYASRGQTPVLRKWQSRDPLSVMAGVTPEGHVYSLVRQESLKGFQTIVFIEHLLHVVGERLWLIWDGSPIHRRAVVQEYLTSSVAAHVKVEFLPAYAPDLNPVEWMWNQLKNVELRNLECRDLEDLHYEFHLALERLRQKPRIILSFFEGAQLSLL